MAKEKQHNEQNGFHENSPSENTLILKSMASCTKFTTQHLHTFPNNQVSKLQAAGPLLLQDICCNDKLRNLSRASIPRSADA